MSVRAAVLDGSVEKLKLLLAQGEPLDTKDEDERTPLHWAAANGRTDIVEFLVKEAKAIVNVQDDAGWTPLMSATSAGHTETVNLLLVNGANANLANENGQIPLHYHKGGVTSFHLRYLVEESADNWKMPVDTCWGIIVRTGRLEIAELLVDYTDDVNHADDVGSTPLTRALGSKPNRDIIALLLDHGAKVNTRDIAGNTPLHLALMEGYEDIARFLIEAGADYKAKNKEQQTCLSLMRPAFRAEIDHRTE